MPYVGSIYGLKCGRSSGGTNPPKKAPAMPDKGLVPLWRVAGGRGP